MKTKGFAAFPTHPHLPVPWQEQRLPRGGGQEPVTTGLARPGEREQELPVPSVPAKAHGLQLLHRPFWEPGKSTATIWPTFQACLRAKGVA